MKFHRSQFNFSLLFVFILSLSLASLLYVPLLFLKEGMSNNGSQSFCNQHSGHELETACNQLTKHNCGTTSCCVWTMDDQCKAGNASGPLFNSDAHGKTLPLDYYYFENKCYGTQCP